MQKQPTNTSELLSQAETMFHHTHAEISLEHFEFYIDYLVGKTIHANEDWKDQYAVCFEQMKQCTMLYLYDSKAAAALLLKLGLDHAIRFIEGTYYIMWELAGTEEDDDGKDAIFGLGLLREGVFSLYKSQLAITINKVA